MQFPAFQPCFLFDWLTRNSVEYIITFWTFRIWIENPDSTRYEYVKCNGILNDFDAEGDKGLFSDSHKKFIFIPQNNI